MRTCSLIVLFIFLVALGSCKGKDKTTSPSSPSQEMSAPEAMEEGAGEMAAAPGPSAPGPMDRAEPTAPVKEPAMGGAKDQRKPIRTKASAKAELAECVGKCVKRRQAEAASPEHIQSRCRRDCLKKYVQWCVDLSMGGTEKEKREGCRRMYEQ